MTGFVILSSMTVERQEMNTMKQWIDKDSKQIERCAMAPRWVRQREESGQ